MSTEADSIAALAKRADNLKEPVVHKLDDGRLFLFTPQGLTQSDISDPNRAVEPPGHIRQAVTLQTVESLTQYVRLFKTATTVLFADIAANKIVGVIDYHHASDWKGTGAADRLFHRATLALPFSEEWRTWTKVHGQMMGQLEFARFLEENAADVAAPSGAELLDTVRDLHAVRKADFKRAVRTATDHETFEYSEETTATTRTGGVEVPTRFLLRIPVYFGGEATEVYAFLRWKLDDGTLNLGVVLQRPEHVRQAVFKAIVTEVSTAVDRPALFGAP